MEHLLDGRSDESLEVIEQMTYLMFIRDQDDALSPPRAPAELCKLVESLGMPPLFVEPQYEDMAVRTISRETGASLFTLDPIVTGPADAPRTYYEDMMRQSAAVPAGALED